MIKEKHTLKNPYNHHALSRYIDVYEVTTDGCSSSPMSGYKGTEATLVDDPAWNEKFSSYSITGATLTGNNFVINNDVTAKANYETAKNVTLQTDGHGSIAANRNSGFIGDQVTLSNTAATDYQFSNYSITGATLTGNKFNFIGNNVTAKANFARIPGQVTIGTQVWKTVNLSVNDGQGGIYSRSVNYGKGNVTEYYYTWDAAVRVAASVQGWHLPSTTEWDTLKNYLGSTLQGKKLKSTYGWNDGGNGTDDYGFAAFPAGYRDYLYETFYGPGVRARYWCSNTFSNVAAYYRELTNTSNSILGSNDNKAQAFSVRLIKD